MHALRALDAFARLGTVWEAAEFLGITRSALSHRLAMLESALGFEVTVRSGKGIALTARGKRYARDVERSLALLSDAHGDGTKPLEGSLCISSTPGFASMWLCNHVGSFQAEHPDLDIRIIANRELDQVSDPEVDLFIAFGDGAWPKKHAQHLYAVDFLPMCSPALVNTRGGLKEPRDLLRFPLLHLEVWNDWREWFQAAKLPWPQRGTGIRFSDLMMVQSAAIAGQGVMMGDRVTCAVALTSGQLVCPFPLSVPSRAGYYLVREGSRRPSLAIGAFTRWLHALFKRVGAELKVGPL